MIPPTIRFDPAKHPRGEHGRFAGGNVPPTLHGGSQETPASQSPHHAVLFGHEANVHARHHYEHGGEGESPRISVVARHLDNLPGVEWNMDPSTKRVSLRYVYEPKPAFQHMVEQGLSNLGYKFSSTTHHVVSGKPSMLAQPIPGLPSVGETKVKMSRDETTVVLFGRTYLSLRLSRRATDAYPVLFGRAGQPLRYQEDEPEKGDIEDAIAALIGEVIAGEMTEQEAAEHFRALIEDETETDDEPAAYAREQRTWTGPHTGPRGGTYWLSDANQKRYRKTMPGTGAKVWAAARKATGARTLKGLEVTKGAKKLYHDAIAGKISVDEAEQQFGVMLAKATAAISKDTEKKRIIMEEIKRNPRVKSVPIQEEKGADGGEGKERAGDRGTGPDVGRGDDAGGPAGGGDLRPTGADPKGAGQLVTVRQGFSRAADAGLVPEDIREHLREHQLQTVALAKQSLDEKGGFLLASGTGSGKSHSIVALAKMYASEGKPVLIVSENGALGKPNWSKNPVLVGSFVDAANDLGVELIPTKGDTALEPGKIYISAYQHMGELAGRVNRDTILAFDESHNAKNIGTQKGQAVIEAAKNAKAVLYASATPVDKPLQIGYLFRSGIFHDKSEAEVYKQLGMVERERTIGRKKVKQWEIDPEVGEAEAFRRIGVLFDDLTAAGSMVKHEISMKGVKVKFQKVKLDDETKATLEKIDQELSAAAPEGGRGMVRANILMQQRRQQEPAKVPHAVSLAKEALDQGRQVVIFASRVNESTVNKKVWDPDLQEKVDVPIVSSPGTFKLLKEALEKEGITDVAELHGGTKSADQQAAFQSGKARVLIATVESGGTGVNLDDRSGDKPRTTIMMTAPFSGDKNVQAAGRTWRLTTKSNPDIHYLFGDTPVDDWNSGIIAAKMDMLQATVEGDVKRLKIPDLSEEATVESAGDDAEEASLPTHITPDKLAALSGEGDAKARAESARSSMVAGFQASERKHQKVINDPKSTDQQKKGAYRDLQKLRETFEHASQIDDPKWWLEHRYSDLGEVRKGAFAKAGKSEPEPLSLTLDKPSLRATSRNQRGFGEDVQGRFRKEMRRHLLEIEQDHNNETDHGRRRELAKQGRELQTKMNELLNREKDARFWINSRFTPLETLLNVKPIEAKEVETPKAEAKPVEEKPAPQAESKPAETSKEPEAPKQEPKKASGTFRKLRDGSWGMQVEGTVQKGDYVTLKRKDGSKDTKRVRDVVWTGQGVTLASFYGRHELPVVFCRDAVAHYARVLWGNREIERILFGEQSVRYSFAGGSNTFVLSSGGGSAHQGKLWDESKHRRDHGKFAAKGSGEHSESKPSEHHKTLWGEKYQDASPELRKHLQDMGAKMEAAVSHKDEDGTIHLHDGGKVKVVRTPGGHAYRAEVTLPGGKVVHGSSWKTIQRAEQNGIGMAVKGGAKYARTPIHYSHKPLQYRDPTPAVHEILFGVPA